MGYKIEYIEYNSTIASAFAAAGYTGDLTPNYSLDPNIPVWSFSQYNAAMAYIQEEIWDDTWDDGQGNTYSWATLSSYNVCYWSVAAGAFV